MFTQIKTRSAPVIINEMKLKSGRAQAVIINSGNANAARGSEGSRTRARCAPPRRSALGIADDLVLVASTGVIGRPLPIEKITTAVPSLVAALGSDGMTAARAILTTDAFAKTAAAEVDLGDRTIRIGGIAKGRG